MRVEDDTRLVDWLIGLDGVQWQLLHHAYGPADDVPGQLRALASPDPSRRQDAYARLYGNVYHQGTRWQASAHVVPFLVALIDDPDTPERGAVVGLLAAIGLGDRRDVVLPWDPSVAFGAASRRGDEQHQEVIGCLYSEDADWSSEEKMQLAELAAIRWDADAFWAAAAHVPAYCRWLTDQDTEVAARAAALLAWFPATEQTMTALPAVHADGRHEAVRASANLTLAYLDIHSEHIERMLGQMLTESSAHIQVTAAIALAYRLGYELPDLALSTLINAKDDDLLPATPPGWDRATRGFVALALQRIGLG